MRPRTNVTWAFPLAVIAVLSAYNYIVNEVLDPTYHGVAALLTGAALLKGAYVSGFTNAELGLTRARIPSGLRYGAGASAVVVAAVAILVAVPSTRGNFSDVEFADMSVGTLLWEVLVRIPTVTAGFEELAFRAVLLAALVSLAGKRWAVALQAVLFGLWHILPTDDGTTPFADITVAVAFTTAAGVLFGVLRLKSRSLAAPFVLHAATNASTFTAAWLVTNHLN